MDPYNRAAGADANFIFFHKLGVSGFWAKTFSSPLALQGNDWAATADVTYNNNLIQAEALRAVVQPDFNPEVGFVERTDLVTNFVDLTLSPRPKTGPIREYNFEGFFRYEPDYHIGNQFNSLAAGNPVLLQEKRLSIKMTYSFLR